MRLSALLFTLCLPLSALAANPPKIKVLGPLQTELGESAPDEALKALKAADQCADSDAIWERAAQSEQQTPLNQLYEMLASAVTCWQTAEKKGAAVGDAYAAVQPYVQVKARYVAAMRSFLWSLDAKAEGNLAQTCKRLASAATEAGAAAGAAVGLGDAWTNAEAKTLAAQASGYAKQLAEMVVTERNNQKCE
jgi:hypothetical protein